MQKMFEDQPVDDDVPCLRVPKLKGNLKWQEESSFEDMDMDDHENISSKIQNLERDEKHFKKQIRLNSKKYKNVSVGLIQTCDDDIKQIRSTTTVCTQTPTFNQQKMASNYLEILRLAKKKYLAEKSLLTADYIQDIRCRSQSLQKSPVSILKKRDKSSQPYIVQLKKQVHFKEKQKRRHLGF